MSATYARLQFAAEGAVEWREILALSYCQRGIVLQILQAAFAAPENISARENLERQGASCGQRTGARIFEHVRRQVRQGAMGSRILRSALARESRGIEGEADATPVAAKQPAAAIGVCVAGYLRERPGDRDGRLTVDVARLAGVDDGQWW